MPSRRTQESPPHPRKAASDGAPAEPHGAPPSTESGMPSRLERIAKRAFEIYQARGGTGGRDLDDWLQAEREVDAEMESATDTAKIRET